MSDHLTTPAPPNSSPSPRLQSPPHTKQWLGLAAAALLVGGLFLATGRESVATDDSAISPLPVVIFDVEIAAEFEVSERLAGRLMSRRRSELGFERGGRLAKVMVEEGDRVEPGALLARLDTRALEARLREQAARVDATRARLDLARLTANRQRKLEASGSLAIQALDEALSEEATLGAQLAADRATLERTEVALDLSRLEAPYAAVVVAQHLHVGSVASAGTSVLSVIEATDAQIKIGVPPEIAGTLDSTRAYMVESGVESVLESARRARLKQVVPDLDPITRTQTAIFSLEGDDDEVLADGSLVWVRVTRSIPGEGAWVPLGALTEGRRGTWTVFAVVPRADGVLEVERRMVEIVHVGENRAFVRGTLTNGDQIVADGLQRLIPGQRVTAISGPPQASAL